MTATTKLAHRKPYSFYRPHPRVPFKNGYTTNLRTGEVTEEPSMTHQSFKDECDINNIIDQYKDTGVIRHVSAKSDQGAYQDLPISVDFQEAMNTVLAAQDAFANLPSVLRNRFQNDPTLFLDYMSDPANQDEIIRLGLAKDLRGPVAGNSGGNSPPPPVPPAAAAAAEPPQDPTGRK